MSEEVIIILASTVGNVLGKSLFGGMTSKELQAALVSGLIAGLIVWYLKTKSEEAVRASTGGN